MKKLALFGILSLMTVAFVKSQVAFSVKPGINLNGATIGIKKGKVVPYLGLQYFSVYQKYENNDTPDPDSYRMSVHVLLPAIGSKIYIVDKESIKGYLNVTLIKPIVFGRYKDNGVVDEDFLDDYNDIKIWGGEASYGMEYFFNEHFSIGGEFGFRCGSLKEHFESEVSDYWYKDKYFGEMTFTSISFNFYL
jgi:hypothetical protein